MLDTPDLTDADRKAQDACPHDATHEEPRRFSDRWERWSETVTVCDDCSAEWIGFPSDRWDLDRQTSVDGRFGR